MRKNVIITGLVLFLLGFILNFLAGAILPGGFTIPFIYGSNQTLWLFVSAVGVIAILAGLMLKKKK